MRKILASLLVLGLVIVACQKENSFESGNSVSEGLLQSDVSGDCLPKNVVGTYVQGTALNGNTEYIEVTVDVTATGSYTVFSDTVNGVYFRLAGTFTALGNNVVKLRGNGTPATTGTFNFRIQYDGQECFVPVTFLPIGAGGPAVFGLSGTGANCAGATIVGTYTLGVALGGSHSVTVNVNVTTIGTYSITTTFQGMTFMASGTFTTTGPQTVVLFGSGTPTTAGVNTVPVTIGTNLCSFDITVGNAGTGTLAGAPGGCTPATVAGTYTVGTALTVGNNVQIQVNVATVGTYTITTNTVTGFSFTATGTFPATGLQNITLIGSGTPTTAGNQVFTVTFGTSSCTFTIPVLAAPAIIDYFPRTTNSNWSYDFDNVFNDSLLMKVISNTHSALGNTYNIFMGTQDASAGFDTLGYFRKNAGIYSRFTNLADYLSFDNDNFVEFTFMRDDQPAGFTWTTPGYSGTITGTAVQIRIKFTILQKDVPVTVNGTTYPNTIVVEEKYEANLGGVWTPLDTVFGYFKDYYSRNVGWILDEFFDGTTGTTPTNVQELRRHQVY